MKEERRKGQDGFVLVVVALVLVALCGFVALGVDVGVLYSARAGAQEVADAAALAGAWTFISQPSAANPSAVATSHATQFALNNSIMGRAVQAGDVSVSIDLPNRRVTVDVTSNQNTYFAKALGTNSADIRVQAIAEASAQSTGAGPCRVKPWFISNTILSSQNACAACTSGEVMTSGGFPTNWAKTKLGQQFTVKPQQPSDAAGPGNFYAIQFPGSGGGNDYRDNIGSDCLPTAAVIQCQQSYSVETGNMVGPTKQGVDDLLGTPPSDTFVAVGDYLINGTTHSDVSKALVMAPIWDTCNSGLCPAGSFGNGTNVNLTIIGFSVYFLEGMQGNDVVARLINVSGCNTTPGGGGSTGGTALSIPIRLVRLP